MIACIASDGDRFAALIPATASRPAELIEGKLSGRDDATASAPIQLPAANVTTARVVLEPLPRNLDFSQVAVIRIAPESSPALGPLSGWPAGIAGDLQSRVRVVNGGTRILGTRHAPATSVQLVNAIDELATAGSRIFAVAAVGALSDSGPEEHLAMLIRERVPSAIVVLSSETGGLGLRERENSAILNAGLVHWAADLRREFSKMFPEADIFMGRGSGGMASADYFERFPLIAFESRNGAIVSGIVEQKSLKEAVIAIPQDAGESVSLYFVNAGHIAHQELSYFAGVCINVNGYRTLTVPATKVSDAGAEWDGLPLVRWDAASPTVPASGSPLAAAARGIGSARVSTEITRVVAGHETGKLGSFAQVVTDDLIGRAITAGADPSRLGVPNIAASPMAYLPEGSFIIRAQLTGESR